METKLNLTLRLWRRGLNVLETAQRIVVSLVLLVLVVLALLILFRSNKPKVMHATALVINPVGTLVEQLSAPQFSRQVGQVMGLDAEETLVKDLIDAILAGAGDKRVKVLQLDLKDLRRGSLTKLQDLGRAIDVFRQSGKKVLVYADHLDQTQYYLAARADEIHLHPMGMITITGFSRYRQFYKNGLDRLGVQINVFRVGQYKSATEPYFRDSMSPEDKASSQAWLSFLWGSWLDDVCKQRKISQKHLRGLLDNFLEQVQAYKGDLAALAKAEHLVDQLSTRDEFRQHMIQLVGADATGEDYARIGFADYLSAQDQDRFGRKVRGPAVGLIVASGSILDGPQPAGAIGGDSLAALIRKAREDKKIKALVLRVDSGGGSAFASEIIRREMELTQAAGKPVVVSMGSTAASGGYWIALASDEVWAQPTTITGSIGIYMIFPTLDKGLARHLGIHTDGLGTTALAGAMRWDRPLSPKIAAAMQTVINKGYADFISRVARSRKMKIKAVDKIARGRVWSGQEAKRLNLVDQLGTLQDALASAARRADLEADFKVRYIEEKPTWQARVRAWLSASISGRTENRTGATAVLEPLWLSWKELSQIAQFNDPNHLYAWFGPGVE